MCSYWTCYLDPFQEGSVTSTSDPFAGADPFDNAFGVTAAQATKVICNFILIQVLSNNEIVSFFSCKISSFLLFLKRKKNKWTYVDFFNHFLFIFILKNVSTSHYLHPEIDSCSLMIYLLFLKVLPQMISTTR